MLIPLTNSTLVALVDDEDFDLVDRWHWHAAYGRGVRPYATRTGSAGSRTDGSRRATRIRLHRFLLNAPRGALVDHINRDTLDCQRANLRLCDASQNAANRIPQDATRWRGVHVRANRWRAQIKVRGQLILLGYFATPEDAARAYDAAARAAFGEFAILNFGDVR
ncbi:HNH endonuclease [Phenylobacterium sp.]|jgi:hypothetical protein|uniref:HNH endonuclease n=1 Tax=Phenylobacterium sp. TaxID=1871053 RepID=UPI0037CBEBFF